MKKSGLGQGFAVERGTCVRVQYCDEIRDSIFCTLADWMKSRVRLLDASAVFSCVQDPVL